MADSIIALNIIASSLPKRNLHSLRFDNFLTEKIFAIGTRYILCYNLSVKLSIFLSVP